MSGGDVVACPVCGQQGLTLPTSERYEDELVIAMVQTSVGTWFPHVRDEHPEEWAQACASRASLNRVLGERMGALPRNVAGTFLHAGQAVGDLGDR
jgi:hypothetical protein